MTSILEDSDSLYWIGTINGGVNLYDSHMRKLASSKTQAADSNTLSDIFVQGIYEDRSGRIWIATQEGGVNLVIGV